jgi:hypothetical protein
VVAGRAAFGVAGRRRGPDCLVWGRGGGQEAAGDMGDADPGGGQGVYHHPKHKVDDRSISAPPVLELTAKVIANACRLQHWGAWASLSMAGLRSGRSGRGAGR